MQRFITSASNSNPTVPSAHKCSTSNSHIQQNSAVPKQPDFILPWNNQYILNPLTPINYIPLPPYFRSVSTILPGTPECYHQCQIPLGIIVSPASVLQAPIVYYYSNLDSIPHCTFCSSYLCPQCKVMIINGLHSWSCAICGKANAFPTITNSKFSIPFDNLIELSSPVYDIVAPLRYYNTDSQSAFAFIIDMSYSAFSTGFTRQFLMTIQNLIEKIPDNSRVCILTMSDSLSIFDLSKFREIVIPDLHGMSLTANQNSIFPPLSECKHFFQKAINILLSRVPSNKTSGNCLLSAIAITEIIMRDIGGVVVINCVNLPSEGPFCLKNRAGNSELDLLQLPDNDTGYAFQEEAIKLNQSGISVHLFCTHETNKGTSSYCDISTISILSRLTNGKCHFYDNFDDIQKKNLRNDLFETLSGQYLWNSSLRIQHSYGLELTHIYSNSILKNRNSLSLPILSKDSTVIFEFNIVKPILHSLVIFQLALYFTTDEGKRIIRVFTFEVAKSNDPSIICDSIDEASLITILTRQAISNTLHEGPQSSYCYIKNEIQRILSIKKKFFSFPYMANSLLSSRILSNTHPLGVDGRMVTLVEVNEMPIIEILLFLYPRLFKIEESKFSLLPLNKSSTLDGFCFLFHTYNRIYIYIKNNANPVYLKNAFGIDSIEKIPDEVPKLENNENKVLQKLINDCWSLSGHFLQTELICQGNSREFIFSELFVDDNRFL